MKRPIDQIVVVTELDAEQQNKVLDFACHLLMQSGIPSILEYLQPISLGIDLDVQDRRKIAKQISSKGLTKSLPIAAMLVSELSGSWQEKRVYEKLQTYVLIGAVRFPDSLSTIKLAGRRLRLIKNKNSSWIFDRIMLSDGDLPSVVSCLGTLEQEIHKSSNTVTRTEKLARVGELRVLLSNYLADLERKPTGPTGPRETAHTEEMIRAPLEDHLRVPGFEDAEIIQAAERGSYKGAAPSRIENQRYLDPAVRPQGSYRSYKAKQHRDARHAINDIRKRAVHAPCNWDALTENEVRRVLKACFEGIDSSNPFPDTLIILSILLGREPIDLLGLPFFRSHRKSNTQEYWYVTKSNVQLTVQLMMPTLRMSKEADAFTQTPINRFSLSIPVTLKSLVRQLTKLSPQYRRRDSKIATDIRERIKSLRKSLCSRLTETRLATYLHDYLTVAGTDAVITKRLRGASLKTNVPQHYDACPQEITQSVFREYVESLLTPIGRNDDWVQAPYLNAPLGSSMNPEPEVVRMYFEQWRSRISRVLTASTDPIFVHNEYVLATYAILSVCSGYRPVRHVFERITDFDPISRELYICDKTARRDSDARCIVLPIVACEQVAHYTSHLESLQRKAWGRNMPAVLAARRALSGDGPLLFRISQDQDSLDDVEYFDPKMVKDWLGKRWPLALNWARHFLCTELRTRRFPFELINAQLGNSGTGPPAFDRFSNLSYRKMVELSTGLDKVLADFEISAIEGLGQ